MYRPRGLGVDLVFSRTARYAVIHLDGVISSTANYHDCPIVSTLQDSTSLSLENGWVMIGMPSLTHRSFPGVTLKMGIPG